VAESKKEEHLAALFRADRAAREAEEHLFGVARKEDLVALFSAAEREAAALPDRREAAMRLERLADLCAQVPGPEMADTLVRILGDEDPAVRVAAGEAIVDVAYERYAEIARAVERALDAGMGGPAMTELPYVVAEIGEPSALKLIKRFLAHGEPDVVAAGIEALVTLGEPDAADAIAKLVDDTRTVALEDAEGEAELTIGELAREALEELGAEG
jgi:HEAT repeat protein